MGTRIGEAEPKEEWDKWFSLHERAIAIAMCREIPEEVLDYFSRQKLTFFLFSKVQESIRRAQSNPKEKS